MTKNSLIREL
ncbi:uncharacterized protein FFFS_11966 [Fusarium fujikuroi]|nr:uncharacterized protein FFFS_11966 [Fusarium fujikuroi]